MKKIQKQSIIKKKILKIIEIKQWNFLINNNKEKLIIIVIMNGLIFVLLDWTMFLNI